jgi:hypothetical protein
MLNLPRQKGYSAGDIHQEINPNQRAHSQQEKLAGLATIPFMLGTYSKISRLLGRFNKRMVPIPHRKNAHLLGSAKDDIGLKVSRTYCIPCECGRQVSGR